MLIKERLKEASDISKRTFTSPAAVIRLAKKMGFSGWNELKEKLLEEIKYLNSHFGKVDANFPFQKEDSLMAVANKIGTLKIETINDTVELLDFEELHKVIHYLNLADRIFIFGTSVSLILAEKFQYKMVRIGRSVNVTTIHSEQFYAAAQVGRKDAAIILSYSGEDEFLIEIADYLLSLNYSRLRRVSD